MFALELFLEPEGGGVGLVALDVGLYERCVFASEFGDAFFGLGDVDVIY